MEKISLKDSTKDIAIKLHCAYHREMLAQHEHTVEWESLIPPKREAWIKAAQLVEPILESVTL